MFPMLCVAIHSMEPSHMRIINASGMPRKPVFSASELPSPQLTASFPSFDAESPSRGWNLWPGSISTNGLNRGPAGIEIRDEMVADECKHFEKSCGFLSPSPACARGPMEGDAIRKFRYYSDWESTPSNLPVKVVPSSMLPTRVIEGALTWSQDLP